MNVRQVQFIIDLALNNIQLLKTSDNFVVYDCF